MRCHREVLTPLNTQLVIPLPWHPLCCSENSSLKLRHCTASTPTHSEIILVHAFSQGCQLSSYESLFVSPGSGDGQQCVCAQPLCCRPDDTQACSSAGSHITALIYFDFRIFQPQPPAAALWRSAGCIKYVKHNSPHNNKLWSEDYELCLVWV